MKSKACPQDTRNAPTEAEIRAYAHHLYVTSGWLPGRDLDNWLEAEASLKDDRARHKEPLKAPKLRSIFEPQAPAKAEYGID